MNTVTTNSNYPVNFQVVNLGDNIRISGQVTVNFTDTTPQQQQVPTLQIISMP